jgi:hypothetical protein
VGCECEGWKCANEAEIEVRTSHNGSTPTIRRLCLACMLVILGDELDLDPEAVA